MAPLTKAQVADLNSIPGYAEINAGRIEPITFAKEYHQVAHVETNPNCVYCQAGKTKRPKAALGRSRVLLKASGLRYHRRRGRVSATMIKALSQVGFDWGRQRPVWLSYKDAKAAVRKAGLKTSGQYKTWKERRALGLPSQPHLIYRDKGWISWAAFLGTKNRRGVKYISYAEAQKIVQRHPEIRRGREYKAWAACPDSMPYRPEHAYAKTGWVSWESFLGKNYGRLYLPFEKARALTTKQKFKSFKQYQHWKTRPKSLPSNPNVVYAGDWKSTGDFLGTGNTLYGDFLPYEKARVLMRKLGIKNRPTYVKKRTKNLPSSPEKQYRGKGWQGDSHFYGRTT